VVDNNQAIAPTTIKTKYKLEMSRQLCFCWRCLSQDTREQSKCTYNQSVRKKFEITVWDVTQEAGYVDINRIIKELKNRFSCKKSYVGIPMLEGWLAQKGLTSDPLEAARRGLPPRTMLAVQLYEFVGGLATNPHASTLGEALEEGIQGGSNHNDEEHWEIEDSSPSIRQIFDTQNEMTPPIDNDHREPGFILDEEIFQLTSFDSLNCKELRINCKSRGLSSTGRQDVLVERLTDEAVRTWAAKYLEGEDSVEDSSVITVSISNKTVQPPSSLATHASPAPQREPLTPNSNHPAASEGIDESVVVSCVTVAPPSRSILLSPKDSTGYAQLSKTLTPDDLTPPAKGPKRSRNSTGQKGEHRSCSRASEIFNSPTKGMAKRKPLGDVSNRLF
jgi:hypothetical protein